MRRRVGGETSTCIHVYRYKSQLRSAEKCATLSCRVAGDAPRACVCPAALKPLSSCPALPDPYCLEWDSELGLQASSRGCLLNLTSL